MIAPRRAKTDVAAICRDVFDGHDAVDQFGSMKGWTDRGEKRSLKAIAERARGGRILDVGVGGGRTIPLLTAISTNYVGVDFAPAMVQRCRADHPDVDLRIADARDLSEFADASFDLIVFSNNGLDAVDHEGRACALQELARVLAPDGTLLFSTLNMDWPRRSRPPWRWAQRSDSLHDDVARSAHWLARAHRQSPFYARCCRNWVRNRLRSITEQDWAIGTLSVRHEYSLLVHFVSLVGLRAELAEVSLEVERIVTDMGAEVDPGEQHNTAQYFHVLARHAGATTS